MRYSVILVCVFPFVHFMLPGSRRLYTYNDVPGPGARGRDPDRKCGFQDARRLVEACRRLPGQTKR
eukprot:6599606-Pyramimonas_sp.AAC.1